MAAMEQWHGTTILGVKRNGKTVIAGDGQVTMGNTVMKPNAKKVRRIGADGKVIGGFAGATADAFTLFERLEKKLEQYNGQLLRAAVELAKDWRTDKYLRNLEALMIVADAEQMLILTGNGDVLEPEGGNRCDRLGRQLCAVGGAGARGLRGRSGDIRPARHEDRGGGMRLHQRPADARGDRVGRHPGLGRDDLPRFPRGGAKGKSKARRC